MLYVTTRNPVDTYTVRHALDSERASDGGCYIPFRAPAFSRKEIMRLKDIPFNQCVADMLNLLFGRQLSAWDVDFCIGRYPVRIRELGNRMVMGETWHNPDWQFSAAVRRLAKLLETECTSGFTGIGIRAAVLFGMYGELMRRNLISPGEAVDISLVSGDFSWPISAWYARQWGLPIGSIVCCCNENNNLWNLVCHGQLHTDAQSVPTFLPEADTVIPEELERLISGCGGIMELESYLECCRTGRMYEPDPMTLETIRSSIYVSVVSSLRIRQTVPGVYATHGFLPSPAAALAYAGLMDYRAKKGKLRCSIVLADKSPVCDSETVADVTGIPAEKIKDLM